MSKIDFSELEDILNSSINISLTEDQYKKITGRNMPKSESYLVCKSALANFALSHGLRIHVQKKAITFERIN